LRSIDKHVSCVTRAKQDRLAFRFTIMLLFPLSFVCNLAFEIGTSVMDHAECTTLAIVRLPLAISHSPRVTKIALDHKSRSPEPRQTLRLQPLRLLAVGTAQPGIEPSFPALDGRTRYQSRPDRPARLRIGQYSYGEGMAVQWATSKEIEVKWEICGLSQDTLLYLDLRHCDADTPATQAQWLLAQSMSTRARPPCRQVPRATAAFGARLLVQGEYTDIEPACPWSTAKRKFSTVLRD